MRRIYFKLRSSLQKLNYKLFHKDGSNSLICAQSAICVKTLCEGRAKWCIHIAGALDDLGIPSQWNVGVLILHVRL
jgi:hypothetical protein